MGFGFYLAGYSQGAEIMVRTMRLMAPGQPLAHRANDLVKAITFGSPCRAPGPTLLGNNPSGAGISKVYTPDVFRSRTYDFVIDGDMYATATDDTLLHLAYEALTALELDLPFAVKVFTLIQYNEFLALLNLANTARDVREGGADRDRRKRLPRSQSPARASTARCRSSPQTGTETHSPDRHRAQRMPSAPCERAFKGGATTAMGGPPAHR